MTKNVSTASTISNRAAELHAKALIIDTEGVCVLLPHMHIPQGDYNGRSYLDRVRDGGLTALNTTMGVGGIAAGVDDLRALLSSMYGYEVFFRLHPDRVMRIEIPEDLDVAKREGRLGVIFGVQNIAPKIQGDPTLLWNLHKLGLRIGQLTHNYRNEVGFGCLEPEDNGLSEFGKGIVREMNQIGILVDLAHGGIRTTLSAIENSEKPIIISHANARTLTDHPRNVTDEVIRKLAARGGVVGITFYAPFCQRKDGQHPGVDEVIDHITHVAEIAGIDHVGIGTDQFEAESEIRYLAFGTQFAGTQRGFKRESVYAEGLERVECLPNLTEGLIRRGFSDEDILKILGGNHRRLFDIAWRPALAAR